MKQTFTALFLLAAIVGKGQSIALSPLAKDTIPTYDTVRVIAEIYTLPHKYAFGMTITDWDSSCNCGNFKNDSVWAQMEGANPFEPVDTTFVYTRKVLAWEVWRKDWRTVWVKSEYGIGIYYDEKQLVPVEMVKRLTYNRKDEITNVLQSWRVQW